MFSSLFSSKSREASVEQKSAVSSNIVSKMKGFAAKVSMVLWLTAAGNIAVSAPMAPENPAYDATVTSVSAPFPGDVASTFDTAAVLPPKAPVITEQKITPIEPLSVQPKLRMAVVQKGESVGLFMLKNFGTQEGWQGRLVSKQTGKIVRVAETDLIAGETVVFARDDNEANNLSTIFKKQLTKKGSKNSSEVTATKQHKSAVVAKKIPSIVWNGWITSGAELVDKARNFLDMTYGLGGNGVKKIDCSGLLNQSMRLAWVVEQSFPRLVSGDFRNIIKKMGVKDHRHVSAGDIIYTPPHRRGGYGHVMMVSGSLVNGKIPVIQASGSHRKVVETLVSYTPNMTIGTPPWVAGANTYAQATTMDYNTVTHKTPTVEEKGHEAPVVIASAPTRKETPKTMVATVSANDDVFDKAENKLVVVTVDGAQVNEVKSETIEMRTTLPETIELASVGQVTNVIETIEQEHKVEVMDKLRNDKTIREDVRKSVLAKLEKVTDFAAYYRENIKHYEMEARKGSISAKRILPDLYKLLRDLELKTASGNDSNILLKRRA